MLNIIQTGFGHVPLVDGEYPARIFPKVVVFNTPNPLIGGLCNRVAVCVNGSYNTDHEVGRAGTIVIRDGQAVEAFW